MKKITAKKSRRIPVPSIVFGGPHDIRRTEILAVLSEPASTKFMS
jgi:hypothetical protein